MAAQDSDIDSAPHGPMDQLSAHLDRGWDLIERGEVDGALLSAEQGLELAPQSPEAHNLLGYVRATQGQADDALELYQQALALDETFVEAMLNAAELLIHPFHDFEGAVRMTEDVLELAETPDEVAEALLLQFDAQMHAGDQQAAARVARRLPTGPFDTTRLDFMVARAHFEAGMHDSAKAVIENALSRDESSADGHYYLGLIQDRRGERPLAVSSFLRARTLDLLSAEPPWAATPAEFEQMVRGAINSLPEALQALLDDAMVLVGEVPGIELVADGVDPRAGLVLDGLSELGDPPRVGRLFIYKRNLERVGDQLAELQPELAAMLTEELQASFPSQLQ